MSDSNSTVSPAEREADIAGERAVEAFELLGNETRLEILLALWEAIDPSNPESASALPFSTLRKRVGMRHGTQFHYHLDKLVGRFVRKTDDGYTLAPSTKRVLSVLLAGTLTEAPSFTDEQIDAACMLCGTPTIVDYSDNILTQRCPNCEGVVKAPKAPDGIIATEYRPPVGLENRTPQEFVQQGKTWHRHQRHAFIEGVCPDCSGTVTATLSVCDAHAGDNGTVCGRCERVHSVSARFVCDICKSAMATGVWNIILTEVPVMAFFHEHGLDTKALEDELAYGILYEAVEQVAVRSKQPLEVAVTVTLDGDSLTVRLDDAARVVEITDSGRGPD